MAEGTRKEDEDCTLEADGVRLCEASEEFVPSGK